jgi:hypothetical protein
VSTSSCHLFVPWPGQSRTRLPQRFKFHFNITFPSKPRTSRWSLSFIFIHQNPAGISPLPLHATCPANLMFLDRITRTLLGVQYRSLSYLLHNSIHSPVTSSLSVPNILLSTLFSNTVNVDSSIGLSDQVLHPCRHGQRYIFIYFIFIYCYKKRGDKTPCAGWQQAFSGFRLL